MSEPAVRVPLRKRRWAPAAFTAVLLVVVVGAIVVTVFAQDRAYWGQPVVRGTVTGVVEDWTGPAPDARESKRDRCSHSRYDVVDPAGRQGYVGTCAGLFAVGDTVRIQWHSDAGEPLARTDATEPGDVVPILVVVLVVGALSFGLGPAGHAPAVPGPVTAVLLGADLGTSGLKVVALDETGAVVAEAEAGYDHDRPAPDRAEIDVAVWRTAFDAALGALDLRGAQVRGLGLSGQMHGAVLVDPTGRALRPAILWPDSRATAELARWRSMPAADRAALANPLVPGMTGPMLAWLTVHEPELVEGAAAVLLPKDAFRTALVPGSALVTDRSDASATLLWDVVADDWSAAVPVPPRLLPAVRPSAEVVGTASLPGGEVPVVVGAADTPLALLAAGTRSGLQVNLGTGAQVLRPGWTPAPAEDPVVHGYADADGSWYAMAALRNGGSAWAWVCDVLGFSWPEFFAAAASVPDAGGAVFRPFLTGERGGVAGPEDRAGWDGLGAGTTRAHLARAAVDGVVRAVADAAALLGVADGAPVVLTGGGGRSALVQQLLADALGRPVRHRPLRSASAIGAALLAASAVGLEVAPHRAPGPLVEPRR
ncbi:FGGY family carbohydrate kinase [Blastococcus sp. LR1]|uniref:FGGY family carbohydrate kinase n=1 Tax=Blastococcus sp. LR1 TaxID=2877000 RepID=UPI001CC9C1D0|nr:FGGY family carbohydrate kinase [Blastococcus sp. LR1]MCA0146335.1 carbohydrate kinase [Blastococcus sp. LR1]